MEIHEEVILSRGNIIRIQIDRAKYQLKPSTAHYASILVGTILTIHKNKVSVKIMDLWGSKAVHYLTINKSEIIAIL